MKKGIFLILVVCCLIWETAGLMADNHRDKLSSRRFAMVVGINDGGPDRVRLKYAVSDARAILAVLADMGGVLPEDGLLLAEPDRSAFIEGIQHLKEKVNAVKAAHRRIEVILYYSGHSDEKNMLLGKEKVAYQEFRDAINDIEADVRIAILDSCASGAFTRLKGGKMKAPFLMDTAYDMKGYAVMTSSSSDEASQESEYLKGSYFTHYLVSGLRGAADMTHDGRITLNEAYQFAFNETLSQTSKTVSGPQHPNYNIQMAGTGDVVMTDIRASKAILIIGPRISGKIFIHNKENVLVLEMTKHPGRPVELGLDEGEHRVTIIHEDQILEAKVHLVNDEETTLAYGDLAETKRELTQIRGEIPERERDTLLSGMKRNRFFIGLSGKYAHIAGEGQFFMGIQFGVTFKEALSVGLAGYGNISTATKYNPFSGNFMQEPITGYGGVIVFYNFRPEKVVHFRAGALMGAGTGSNILSSTFFVFEPEFDVNINLSKHFKTYFGVSYRITDRSEFDLHGPSFCFGIQYER